MTQYINKSALVAEIKGYISNYMEIEAKTNRNDSTWVDSVSMIDAKIDVLQHVLFFLDTLEVKEVDLEKEVDIWYDKFATNNEFDWNGFAQHFFELGLNARKEDE